MSNTKSIEEIQQMYRKCRLMIFLMLLFLVSALVLFFFNQQLSFLVLGISILYYLFLLKPAQKNYMTAFTQSNIACTIGKILDASNVTEKGNGGITAAIINNAHLMPCKEAKGSPLLCWGISGQVDDLSISLCDATIAQDFTLVEKGRKRVHFNSGVWAHINLPADTGKTFCLLDETSVPTPIRMNYFENLKTMETAPIQNADLGKRFVLYRPINDESQQPSTALLNRLQSLMEYTPGYVALSLHDNELDVFVRGRFLARPVSMSKAPTEDLLNFDPFPELSYLIKLSKACLR